MTSLTKPKEQYLKAFLIGIGLSAAFFIPFIIADQGYFLFYGDFKVKQVPFYQLEHKAIHNGEWFWNFKTDLGANFIGSYSFYLLGSPFFWLTMPFPNSFLPYLMGPLLILKFGCATLTAYAFLTRFVKNKDYAVLGSILYAFSGFSIYNVFFNHFHEAIIVFPLLLLGLEMFIVDGRRGVFALTVTIAAVTNYFFFWGMVIFTFIYFFARIMSGEWKITVKSFGLLAFEAVIGLVMGAFLLLPSILAIASNTRVSSILLGWNALLYGKEQIYTYIFQSFFFPPDLPARPVFFDGADVKWSSVAGWLPLFSMTGVFAYLHSKKKSWQNRIIGICFIMSMIPILNASFYAFNSSYYARWFYMPVLIMSLMTAKGLEDESVDMKKGLKTTLIITLVTVAIIGFMPNGREDQNFAKNFGLYTEGFGYRFMITSMIAVASLLIVALLLKIKKNSLKQFTRMTFAAVSIITVIYSAVFIGLGKSHSYLTTGFIIPRLIESNVSLPDQDTVRVDVYEGMDNTAMFFNMSSINAFHSVVPSSIPEFYEYIGDERSVASRPSTDDYAIRSFLSVKYLLNYSLDSLQFEANAASYGGTMPYYVFHSEQNGYKIYENQCYIPYGFTYDYFIPILDTAEMSENDRQLTLLKAIILDEKQQRKYPFLENIHGEYSGPTLDTVREYSVEQYYDDCAERAKTAGVTTFNKNSFTHKTTLEKENLVFFSIPYDEGWTAYVDGVQTDIEKVNIGFMAVYCTAGEHTIEFKYKTPGLTVGFIITGASVTVFATYVAAVYVYRKKKKANAVESEQTMPEESEEVKELPDENTDSDNLGS